MVWAQVTRFYRHRLLNAGWLTRLRLVWARSTEFAKIEKAKYYNADMRELMEEYKDFVIETLEVARQRTPDAELIIEDRLDLTKWVKNSFGTADAQIIADGTLNIIDLKYGQDVKVDAEGNEQMMLYALGAVDKTSIFYDIEEVTMTIYQPRLYNISTYRLSVDELYKFAEKELKPKAAQAYAGKGDFAVGDHCRFCKVKPRCRAYAKHFKKPQINVGIVADGGRKAFIEPCD